jgi:nicotinamidase-related amidase
MMPVTDALIVVDMQKGFDDPYWGPRNNPEAEYNGLRLLAHWRRLQQPILFAMHCSTSPFSPLRPGQPGHDAKVGFEPRPNERVVAKQVNSAFIGTDLQARLQAQGIGHLTIFGLTTDQCVSTTVRMASNLGFHTTLVEDACACFDQTMRDGTRLEAALIHNVHVTTLLTEFAEVITTDELVGAPVARMGAGRS